MRTLLRRTLVTGAASLALLGVAATQAQAAITPAAAKTAAAQSAQPYIYGYYANYLDCEVVGAYGLYNGWWRNYICDSRYASGYFTLVIAG